MPTSRAAVARLVVAALALASSALHAQEVTLIPGLIVTLGCMMVIRLVVTLNLADGPAGNRAGWSQRLASVVEVLPVVGVFLGVIIGLNG